MAAAAPGDRRFFLNAGPYALGDIAKACGAETAEPDRLFHGVAPLQSAGPGHVSFLDNRRYVKLLAQTKAGAVILHPDLLDKLPPDCLPLATAEPYLGWARVAALFHPAPRPSGGIDPAATVDATATVAEGVQIGAGAVIGAGAEIAAGTIIGPLAVIGAGVVVGAGCRIHAHATVSHAILGHGVTVFPGARIGQDGFGFAITKTGFVPVPQLGRVLIGDGAEIGANTTIDRGSAQDTVIGAGVHIDNLVQIGHNVTIGAGSVVVAQAGISGSTALGARVMVAAQAGLTGHLSVGDGARIGAQSGVMADVAAGQEVLGAPAQPAKSFFREVITLRKLVAAARSRTPGSGQE